MYPGTAGNACFYGQAGVLNKNKRGTGFMTLDELETGGCAKVISVNGSGSLRNHLLDMGLTPGTEITLMKVAPMGDPVELGLRGYELTLRLDDAREIEIEKIQAKKHRSNLAGRYDPIAHPGVGELGKAKDYHNNKTGEAIQKGQPVTFALAGNQNCGKTTLFNQLTGSNQHVGNFPGVTVDKKEGIIRGYPEATVVDLPGIYSLSPYSNEEIVTRDFLMKSKPDGIINIIDTSNFERNLYLTIQLMELGIPMVLALNMMDEVRANGGTVHVNELEEILGIPVVPVSAVKNEGISELVDHAMHVARYREAPGRIDFCPDSEKAGDAKGSVHGCIHAVVHLLEPYAKKAGIPVRFASVRMIEGDSLIKKELGLPSNENEVLEGIVNMMEKESGLDRKAALADMRFGFIEKLCQKTIVRPGESREHKRSVAADRILTGKYTAIPCFIGIMAVVFIASFSFIGAALSDLMSSGVGYITGLISKGLMAARINPVVQSLVVDGICSGVGSVLSFLPTIVTLFFFLSILEDSGYMARVAFVMDKLLRRVGLSGKSFVPMLVGFGCSVPAIMATRTLSSERDRKMTILLTPFMSCSAKLPVYGLFTSAFFPKQWRGIVMVGLYLFGIVCAVLYAIVLKHSKYKGEPVPFVMELPNYRLPGAKSVCHLIWDKAKGFVHKAFTIIFVATIIIWFLQTFDIRLDVAKTSDSSLLAGIGSLVAPLFAPLGFGDWRVSTALITGFAAKESIVSTLTVLMDGDVSMLPALFTPLTAVVFLVFTLLYTPCVAAIATVKQEIGSVKPTIGIVAIQCSIAWVMAFLVNIVGGIFL